MARQSNPIKVSNPVKIWTLVLAVFVTGAALVPPAVARVGVVGALSRRMQLTPGQEAQGRVLVRNQGNDPRVVKAYLTDYQSSADGKTRYGEAGGHARSNAPWVHIVPAEQTVAPGDTAAFNFVVRVPDDPGLAGTYWSMLMVEPVPAAALVPPQTENQEEVQIRIGTVVRTSIHLVTQISGTGRAGLEFSGRKLVQDKAQWSLHLDLENTGERYLGMAVWAELFDDTGISIGRFDAPRIGLFPGGSARAKVPLAGVPSGTYQALIVADDGGDNVFGGRYEIVIP